jgi:hypothetical protein
MTTTRIANGRTPPSRKKSAAPLEGESGAARGELRCVVSVGGPSEYDAARSALPALEDPLPKKVVPPANA